MKTSHSAFALALSLISSFASAGEVKFTHLPTASITVETEGARSAALKSDGDVMKRHSANEKEQLAELRHYIESDLKKQIVKSGCSKVTGSATGIQSQCSVQFL